MYEYKCKIRKVVDGDTVDIDIDLGFGVWLNDERVRIMGIDTPESRTSDPIEKIFGKAANRQRLVNEGKIDVEGMEITKPALVQKPIVEEEPVVEEVSKPVKKKKKTTKKK